MKINQRKIGVILSYVQIVLSNTISLMYTPIALRMLGQSQYGLFGTANSYVSYLSLLTLGIGGAYIRWHAKCRAANDEEGERRLNGMYFTMFSVITAVTLVVGFVLVYATPWVFQNGFSDPELHDLQLVILLTVLNTAFTFFMNPIFGYIQSNEKFLILRITSIANVIVAPVANLIILFLGGKAVAISKMTLLLTLVSFVVYALYAVKVLGMRFSFKGFNRKEFREIFLFSSFILINTISSLISESTDGVVLGIVSGPIAVAVYTVGRNFQNYFLQFSVAISSVFSPSVNKMVAQQEDDFVLTQLMLKVGRVQFYVASLVVIGFTFLGKPFIYYWAGEGYEDAYIIGLLLLTSSMIPLFQNVGLEIQKAKNKHQARTIIYLLVAVVNIILTIPFSIWWGGIGAVLATFLCTVFGQVIFMNVYYHKAIGLDMIYFWKGILKIIPSFIPTILVGVLFNTVIKIDSLWNLLFAMLAMCAVYLVSIWLVSMNEYEKNLIKAPVKNLWNKYLKR